MNYALNCILMALAIVCGGLVWLCCAVLAVLYRALPLILAVIFTVWFLTGCVYNPVHVELYNSIHVQDADIGLDASRTSSADLYEQAK